MTEAEFSEALADLRGRRRTALVGLFCVIPVTVTVLASVWVACGEDAANRASLFAFVATMAIAVVFGLRLVVAKCPRCNENYFWRNLISNPLGRRCMHCRLPLDA